MFMKVIWVSLMIEGFPLLINNVGIERMVSQNDGEVCLVDASYDDARVSGPLVVTIAPGRPVQDFYTARGSVEAALFFGNRGIGVQTPWFQFYHGLSIPIQASQVRLKIRVTNPINPAIQFPFKAFVTEGASPKLVVPISTYDSGLILSGAARNIYIPDFAKNITITPDQSTDFQLDLFSMIGGVAILMGRYFFASGQYPMRYPIGPAQLAQITNKGGLDVAFTSLFELEF